MIGFVGPAISLSWGREGPDVFRSSSVPMCVLKTKTKERDTHPNLCQCVGMWCRMGQRGKQNRSPDVLRRLVSAKVGEKVGSLSLCPSLGERRKEKREPRCTPKFVCANVCSKDRDKRERDPSQLVPMCRNVV